jgi:hypothetical protein
MAKIAVDVVLLPSERVTNQAIEANKGLLKQYADRIVPDKENCLPHITIGYGQVDDFTFTAEFTASKLALCHLGIHCTCRKVLAAAELEC